VLTVGDLVRLPDLEVRIVAGRTGLGREVRWAHVTELADPVPWLRGGELVLTVGHGLGATGEERRGYVERLHAAGCAGLGVAVDTWIDRIPEEVAAAADEVGLPLLRVEGTTPFIAVVEAVADHHAATRLRAQQRVLAAQDAMARAALRAGAPGVLRELAAATGGEAVLFAPNGAVRATSGTGGRPWHASARAEGADTSRPRGMTVLEDAGATVLAQSLSFGGTALGRLALRTPPPVSTHTRMLANHAASLLAVDLRGARAARRGLHRQRARVLGLLLDDGAAPRLAADAAHLLPLPAPPLEVAVYPAARPDALLDTAADAVPDLLGEGGAADRVAMCVLPGALVVVLPDTGERPRPGERLLAELRSRPADPGAADPPDAAGACAARTAADLRGAVRRAERAAATGPGYRHVDDADPLARLRRTIAPGDAEEFVVQVLGRLREHDARNGAELVGTLRRFLENDANIEATARAMGVHRNTLRARLRTAERVSGRPLGAHHRLELMLALALDTAPPPGG
jgi:purine catabolism regulator